MILLDRLADLEEGVLLPAIIVIDQEAAVIPIVLCAVKHFELYKGSLAGLHARMVLLPSDSLLFRRVLNKGKVVDR